MYRRRENEIEVLIAHPGGPFFRRREAGAWTLPKGLAGAEESLEETARREFREEIGVEPASELISLGSTRQKGGKVVHAWAFEGDCEPDRIRSNTFELEWPPRSGEVRRFPEIDRARFASLAEARRLLLPAQAVFLDRLEAALEPGRTESS